LAKEEVIIAINTDIHSVSAEFYVHKINSQPSKVIYGKAEIFWHNQHLKINLPPRSGSIFI
jgi:hypothetical protein